MNEKYMVTVFQKIYLNENILIFRNAAIMSDVDINMKDDLKEVICQDENQNQYRLEFMETPYVFVSENLYCYGYPIEQSILEKRYPKLTENERKAIYVNEVNKNIHIALFDDKTDKYKIISINKKDLQDARSEEIFNNFKVSYESEDDEQITVSLKDFEIMMNQINNNEYETLKIKAKEVLESLTRIKETAQKEKIKDEQKKQEEINEILKELDSLTGLDNIKSEIHKLLKYLIFRKKVKNELNLEMPNLHMFFSGNPGTGKTTVARIIGRLLYKLGYISKNTVAEITPKDLIAGYVGQTAIKTAKLIEKNKGGVIFIDEAYILAGDSQKFAGEALVEILKELEKNETVFIFAGYKDEMEQFMSINPGLTSRIGYYLEYKDYTKEELYEIFKHKTNKMGFKVTDDIKDKIICNLETVMNNNNFGNGRYIDKLINKLILEHAIRTENTNNISDLVTLTEEDWNEEIEQSLIFKPKQKMKKIGFNN